MYVFWDLYKHIDFYKNLFDLSIKYSALAQISAEKIDVKWFYT